MATSLLCRDTRLDRAIDRDLRDAERLDHFESVILVALDAIARDVYPLEHPNRSWHPGDLVDALQDQLTSIRHERLRTRGPVIVLEDDGV